MIEREIEFYDYGYDGEGVGKAGGKIIFVPCTLRGEIADVELTKKTSSFCKGRVVRLLRESPERQIPPCPYFGICGGCAFQHTSYSNELEIKKQLLSKQLAKVGYNSEITVVQSPLEYGYRNKIKLFVGYGAVGLKEKSSDRVVDIDNCKIASPMIDYAIKYIKNFIRGNNLYSKLSNVVIREENDFCTIEFVQRKKCEIDYQGLRLVLGEKYGIFESFGNEIIRGMRTLCTEEMGLQCEFSPRSFHQVNIGVCKLLYDKTVKSVVGKNVVNCYSGAGVLSGVLEKAGFNVTGIELGQTEHNDAQRLKELNCLNRLHNICGDAAEMLPKVGEKIDTLIVDPPRRGMSKDVCATIAKLNFKRMIYISCNSSTLVRDIQRIGNVKVESATLFDMFARTGEYETLVTLKK